MVKINSANQLMVQGQEMNVKQLREKAKEFIANVNDDANLPKLYEEDFGAPFGVVKYAKNHVISVISRSRFKRSIRRRFRRLSLKTMEGTNYGKDT